MKFVDPFTVQCPRCGRSDLHAVSELLALSARCRVCAAALDETGRRMRAAVNRSDAFALQVVAIVELSERFGFDLDPEPPEETTGRGFLEAIAAQLGRDPDDAELVDRVVGIFSELVERPLTDADLDRGCLEIFATYPDEFSSAPRSAG